MASGAIEHIKFGEWNILPWETLSFSRHPKVRIIISQSNQN